jgi:hypothetical protein
VTTDGSGITDTVDLRLSPSDSIAEINGLSGREITIDPDDLDDSATTNKFTDQADIDKLAGIEALAEVNPDVVSQVEAEAGVATTERIWTSQRVAQAIAAQAVTGGISTGDLDTSVTQNDFVLGDGGHPPGRPLDRQVMAGGQYGFQPRTAVDGPDTGSTEYTMIVPGVDNNGIYGLIQSICFTTPDSSAPYGYEARALTRYVNSSAPWNMGHGDIGLFLFLKIDGNGHVTSSTVSDSPPWGYNGKTSVVPDKITRFRKKDNRSLFVKKYKMVANPEAEIIVPPWRGGDPAKWDIDKYLNPEMVEVEIDHDMKNKDMEDIPHPFMTMSEGDTVVLVDPCSDIVDNLISLYEKEEKIGKLFRDGYLELTSDVNCTAPPGVVVKGAKWTNKGINGV